MHGVIGLCRRPGREHRPQPVQESHRLALLGPCRAGVPRRHGKRRPSARRSIFQPRRQSKDDRTAAGSNQGRLPTEEISRREDSMGWRAGGRWRDGVIVSDLARLGSGPPGRPLRSHRADEFISAVWTDAVGDARRPPGRPRRHVVSRKGDTAPGTYPDPGRRRRGISCHDILPLLAGRAERSGTARLECGRRETPLAYLSSRGSGNRTTCA
jgi:hypothetical protein